MKKILSTLFFLLLAMPCYALDIPYVTYMPYKPYKKEIKLNKISSESIEQGNISIVKNKYSFGKSNNFGYAYEYFIKNDLNTDVKLRGVISEDFYSRGLKWKCKSMQLAYVKSAYSDWHIVTPVWGDVRTIQKDIEKYPFMNLYFPRNILIKNGDDMRVLTSAPLDSINPQAEFIFLVNGQEQRIKF